MMRKTIFYFFVSFILFHITSLAQNEWTFINDNPPLIKVFSSSVIGNTAYFWCDKNIVFKTSDGGETFKLLKTYAPIENTTLGCCSNHGIAFADSLTGYITDAAHGEFRTFDGGKNWIKTAEVGSNTYLVEFGSSSVGWKVGYGGLYKTTDAGKTWNYISAPFMGVNGIFSNIFAFDEEHIWILKSYYGTGSNGSIWYSSNGGFSWAKLYSVLSSYEGNQVHYNDLLIKTSGKGITVGDIIRPSENEKKSFIQLTNNFGLTWTIIEFPYMNLKNILSVDDSTWIIFGNTGNYSVNDIVQLRSTDYGKSWVKSNPIKQEGFNYLYDGLYIPSFNTIILSTVNGYYKSIDNGLTYSPIHTKYGINIKDVFLDKKPPSSESQIIFGSSPNRSYLFSDDGGNSWNIKEIPSELGNEIFNVSISEGVIYIIVDQTHLYKSTNKGNSWSSISLPIYSGIRGLDVYDKNTLVLQAYTNLCISTDGGETWATSPFPNNYWINESFMISPSKIVAVGGFNSNNSNKGILYNTLNKGLSWRIEDTPYETKQINMITKNIGFALSYYKLYKSVDGGDNWAIINSVDPSVGTFSSFCFKDTLNGLLFGRESFWKTTDGGHYWIKININFPFEHSSRLIKNKKDELFTVSNGYLLKHSLSYPIFNNQSSIKSSNKNYILLQNYPNPFNPFTTLKYELPEDTFVKIDIYNLLGQRIKTLVNANQKAGTYNKIWNGKDDKNDKVTSGVYIYRIKTSKFSISKKMLLMK